MLEKSDFTQINSNHSVKFFVSFCGKLEIMRHEFSGLSDSVDDFQWSCSHRDYFMGSNIEKGFIVADTFNGLLDKINTTHPEIGTNLYKLLYQKPENRAKINSNT